MAAVLDISGLQKTYRSRKGERRALDGFDMVVEAGQVHGFLGPNGSGKTTTLRTLLGLIRPDGGRMALLGREVPAALPEVAGQVGAIVESPQFFKGRTGRNHLRVIAASAGLPQSRVDDVMKLVGLTPAAKRKFKGYSLGMKQRLAVASALLKSPQLLILDEPANGLDPGGIREMRDLMRQLAGSGMTVVLSSHILGEVQQICDSVTIISRGRRVAHGPVAEVLAQHATAQVRVRLEAVTQLPYAAQVLTEAGAHVVAHPDHLLVTPADRPALVTRTLAAHNLFVSELSMVEVDLESVFLELTGTAPVSGEHRQVDQSVVVPAAVGTGPVEITAGQDRWGR